MNCSASNMLVIKFYYRHIHEIVSLLYIRRVLQVSFNIWIYP